MDQDGDLDIAFTNSRGVHWQRQQEGEFQAATRIAIEDDFDRLHSTDVDGDGDVDLIVTPNDDTDVVWIENINQWSTPQVHAIYEPSDEGPILVTPADLDLDGDLDLLLFDNDASELSWFETTSATNRFDIQHVLWSDAPALDQVFAVDLLGGTSPEILVHDNATGSTWMLQLTDENWSAPTEVYATPDSRSTLIVIDEAHGNGPTELILASDGVARRLVPTEADNFELGDTRFTYSVSQPAFHVIDLDGNDESDLLVFGGAQVELLKQNIDQSFSSVATHALPSDVRGVAFNNAGSPTLLYATPTELAILSGAAAEFELQHASPIGPQLSDLDSLQAADIDQDGRTDLVTVANGRLLWRPQRESEVFASPIPVDARSADFSDARVTDIDGDGDADIVARSGLSLWLYRNMGYGNFAAGQRLRQGGVTGFRLADLDHDGLDEIITILYLGNDDDDDEPRDLEVLSLTADGSVTREFEASFPYTIVDVQAARLRSGELADLVIRLDDRAQHPDNDVIEIYRQGAELQFTQFVTSAPILIDHERNQYQLADLDGDGAAELVVSRETHLSSITIDDDGLVESEHIFDTRTRNTVFEFNDLDRDGDLDLIINEHGASVAWNDGNGQFENLQPIGAHLSYQQAHVFADLNFDGSTDILIGTRSDLLLSIGQTDMPVGDVNQDGSVNLADLTAMQLAILNSDLSPDEVRRYDLDSSGRVDASDGMTMAHGVLDLVIGDINLDGVFDSSDLVELWQASGTRYEDEVDGNSLWLDGDWTLDGDFDSADLVFALRFGRYT